MKLASYTRNDGSATFGVVSGESDYLVNDLALLSNGRFKTLRELLSDPNGLDFARTISAKTESNAQPLNQVRLLPVIPDPEKIFCVGINYATHVKETGRETPKYPMIFTRFAQSQIGAGANVILPHVSDHLDFEGELAVIIGKKSRYVSVEEATSRIAGYSCYNDVSVRDWQRHTIQFTPGKNFPGTGAFGPWMVTTDELLDVSSQSLQTRLNGQVMQDTKLDDMIFDVAALISYCSSFTILEPGDVIITGTTGGVGAFRQPPVWMKPGDTVEVEISGIGLLQNKVAKEPDDARI